MSDPTARMSTIDDPRQAIREFVMRRFPVAKEQGLKDADSLLDSGAVDSLGILDVVSFLEESFALKITDDDLNPEDFDSIDTLVQLVENKRG